MSTLLQVRDLRVHSGPRELLHGIDLRVERGERVGLIGESGSGKTLTLLALMGLLPETLRATGAARLDGEDRDLLTLGDRASARLRGRRISMVFQEPMTALDPLLPVGRQVAEILTLHGFAGGPRAARARSVELLDGVGLPDPAAAARAYPHQLSGGQRQRVMLAMAMANTPDLLLADEPTTALDVTVQRRVLDLMREQVARSGTSLVFVTHDLGIVADLCDRVVILRDGAVVEAGPLDRVFSAPQHPYTRSLLAVSALATDARGRLVTVLDLGAGTTGAGTTDTATAGAGTTETGPHEVLPDEGTRVFNHVPGAAPLLAVADLRRTYVRPHRIGRATHVQAVRDVSFEVREGQRFGVVGESGSGKSTLLRLVTGLDQATAGSVRIAGREVVGTPERALGWLRRTAQIVFQDPMGSLDPRMRIAEVVTEPLRGVGADERRARAAEVLDAVGLPATALDRYPHQFSGGQRQRIAIARAVVTRPQLLVADEAVSSLDVSVRAQVLNLLSDLADEYGLTLLFVSHDLAVVRRTCDTVAVMNEGRIVECGPTDQVYEHPLHPYTAELVAAAPRLRTAGA
ncbi:ABC transporter ATP-binding protein [Cellulomonas sp. NTE-D12]|uniref:dipeptide ABC transporter ATP-binding protein n=1 Tax=Cellulomonas sp. NTE-D12 TaxID=2962632 RepID=UPI0030812E98|nr:ABC transporter ATP-binding protein [Cellulomonas sp. NTE-D12]